jgi:hypothetical protein
MVTLTRNATGIAPDSFSFSILDAAMLNIPTNDPLVGANRLLALDIVSATVKAGAIQRYQGASPLDVSLTAVGVPEPASVLLFGAALATAGARRWLRRRRHTSATRLSLGNKTCSSRRAK